MKHLFALTLATVAQAAFAAGPAYYFRTQTGKVELYREAGNVCIADAKRAVFTYDDGRVVEGCWKRLGDGSVVSIAYFYGDTVRGPFGVFAKLDES